MKKIEPIKVTIGKTYKNFRGHWRIVLAILETSDGVKVKYIDDTNTERLVRIDSFRQWIKKNYY